MKIVLTKEIMVKYRNEFEKWANDEGYIFPYSTKLYIDYLIYINQRRLKMSKGTFTLDELSNEVILRELLRRHGQDTVAGDDKLYLSEVYSAPTKIEFVEKHYEVIADIGKDNHAKIYLTQDDIDALNDLLEIKEAE